MTLSLKLFGPFHAEIQAPAVAPPLPEGSQKVDPAGDLPVTFTTERSRLLLIFLATPPVVEHRREALCHVMWPDREMPDARRNLRTELSRLRRALGEPQSEDLYIWTSRNILGINLDQAQIDASRFDQLLQTNRRHQHLSPSACPACIQRMEQAAALYTGPFLANIGPTQSDELDSWIAAKRHHFHSLATNCIKDLYGHFEEQGSLDKAEFYAQQMLGLEPWLEDAHQTLMRVFLRRGQRASAILQYEKCKDALEKMVDAVPSQETEDLVRRIREGKPEVYSGADDNPYRGLEPFTSADANLYFGREEIVLRLLHATQERRLIALIGPSGSGKSSLLQAGLVPNLAAAFQHRHEDANHSWQHLIMRPGERPFHSLARTLLASFGQQARRSDVDKLADSLRTGTKTPSQSVAELAARPAESGKAILHRRMRRPVRLLLIIDQFEEIYSQCSDVEERQAFIAMLLQPDGSGSGDSELSPALFSPDIDAYPGQDAGATKVLLTLRADFMGYILADRDLADALQDSSTGLGPMRAEEMRRAIEMPARQRGTNFESGLVERLLEDVGDEPGRLPLVEFTLTQLWENRRQGWITHAAYDDIGGVMGALANYADGVYAALAPEEKENARLSFLQMIQPGLGTADSRRPATRHEIGPVAWNVVRKLADARLVITGRNDQGHEIVELVHEALIREWGPLRQWIEEDRSFRTWQQRLRVYLNEWEQLDRDSGSLLRGGILAEAENWLAQRQRDLSQAEFEFISAGIAFRDAQIAEEKLRQANALQAAQAVAASEAKATLRLRRLVYGVATALVLVLALAFYAFNQQSEARRLADLATAAQMAAETERARAQESADLALARQLSAQALQVLDFQTDLGVLLSLESLDRTEDPVDTTSLLSGLNIDPFLVTFLHGNQSSVDFLTFAPDGESLISVNTQHEIRNWAFGPDLALRPPPAGEIPAAIPTPSLAALLPDAGDLSDEGEDPLIQVATMSGTGRYILYLIDHQLSLWDARSETQLMHFSVPEDENIASVNFSLDDRLIFLDTDGPTFRIWETATGQLTGELLGPEGRNNLCGVNEDGSLLAIRDLANLDPQVGLWDVAKGEYLSTPQPGHVDDIHDCSFSPDGSTLATAGFDGTIRLWDTATGELLMPPLQGHNGRVLVATFSPDGRMLASGATDNRVILWDVESGTQIGQPLSGHENWVRSIVFSPDGGTLATSDSSGKIALWQVSRRHILRGHSSRVRSVVLSPDEQTFITSGFDRRIVWWDAQSGEMRQETETAHANAIIQIGISPDGLNLASVDAGGRLILWRLDPTTGQWSPRAKPITVMDAVLIGLAFNSDSNLLAIGGFSGEILLWDVNENQLAAGPILAHDNGWALTLAFSPDGQILVSGSTDATIRRWTVPDLAPVGEPMEGHGNWVNTLLFEPDGQVLISGASDQTILRWSMEDGTPIGLPLTGVPELVWGLSFAETESGQALVALGGNGSVTWWNWQTLEPLGPPLRTGIETESMAVNAAGDRVFLGTFDETAQIWQLTPSPWAERACAIANRNMTEAEWHTYLRDIPYHSTCF